MGVSRPSGFGRRFSATHSFLGSVLVYSVEIEVLFFRDFARTPPCAVGKGILWRRVGHLNLDRPRHTGSVGLDELCRRADEFVRGRWADLLNHARDRAVRNPGDPHGHDDKARRGAAARGGKCPEGVTS